ncbi:uncharacterized protein LOC144281356 isoform X1 [Canis aureus]
MSRLRGAPGLLRTCCEASRGCEAYSTVTGDLAYSGPADYDSGTHGATCALTGARLPQDPLEDTGGTVGATSMSEGTPQNHRTVEPKIANPRNHQKPTLMQTHEGLFTSSSLCPSIPDTVEQGLGPPGASLCWGGLRKTWGHIHVDEPQPPQKLRRVFRGILGSVHDDRSLSLFRTHSEASGRCETTSTLTRDPGPLSALRGSFRKLWARTHPDRSPWAASGPAGRLQ